MVKLNKIYTRTGDKGTSGLVTGERRAKSDIIFEAIGAVDEVSAVIGMARIHVVQTCPQLDAMLARIQNDLFDLGADLATPEKDGLGFEALRIVPAQVERLENEIDALNAELQPLRSFILPGGSPAAAALHLARTVARRAEREMVRLSQQESSKVAEPALQYINRLSDLLFVAARVVNDNGATDVLWVPGQNR
jgi:cob(I)alamin adenosyltransferase